MRPIEVAEASVMGRPVRPIEVAEASVMGRPVRPIDMADGWGRFAGVKLTGDEMHLVITDGRARVLRSAVEPLPDSDPAVVADRIARALDGVSAGLDAGLTDLDGVGVSVGGVVNRGVVEDGVFLDWRGVAFESSLAERLGAPVVVENDVVALAEAQRWFGVGRDRPGFALITVGVGVGYGLVANGRVVRSREAGVSLAAHVRLVDDGPRCALGHAGCAVALLTSDRIAARYEAFTGRPADVESIWAAAARGDAAARRVAGESAVALGRFVALAANLTLQSTVVLASDGIGLWELEEQRIRAAARDDRDPRADALDIVVDDSGFAAWARGAAVVAIQRHLDSLEGSGSGVSAG